MGTELFPWWEVEHHPRCNIEVLGAEPLQPGGDCTCGAIGDGRKDPATSEKQMRQPVLYQETKCDHGHMNMHDRETGETVWSDTDPDMKLTCLGGSREEFVVNRRAAVQVFRDAGYNNKGLQILLDQAIDASLGIVEPF